MTDRRVLFGVGMIGGGLLLALGSFLPWITATAAFVGTISRNGVQDGGDGIYTLVIGVVQAGLGVSALAGADMRRLRWWAIATALVAVGFVFFEFVYVRDRVAGIDLGEFGIASIGAGLYVMGVGAAVATFSALTPVQAVPRATHPPGPHRPDLP